MALEHIDNQPWIFQDRNEYQACKKTDSACNLIADGDEVKIQFRNTPCGSPLLCDSDFGSSAGDLVSNGAFASGSSGWTLGATWTWNALGYMDVAGVVSSALSQNIPSLVEDSCYVLVFTVKDYVSGSLLPVLGGTSGTSVNANGTYRQVIVAGAGGDLQFVSAGNPNEISLDDVMLFEMGFCWCPDNGYLYHGPTGDNAMCHVPGAATVLSQVGITPPIVSGNIYKVQITISGRSAGYVHLIVGSAAVSADFEGNGTFTDYVTADMDNSFAIYFSSDFDGCVTDVLVYEMTTDHGFVIVNADDTPAQDMSIYATYVDEYVILAFDTTDFTFDHGCYRILSLDGCDASFDYSNCFNWQSSHDGTRKVIAIDRASTDPNNRYSFGFLWYATSFYLIQRVKLHFRKPTGNSAFNADRYSTGLHFKSYVERSKRWELAIEHLDETQHGSMDIMTLCKSWSIDGVEYNRYDEEYTPVWDEFGVRNVADVKLSVSRKQDVIFADNCNR